MIGNLAVFLFHSPRFFDFGDRHVKNPVLYGQAVALESFMTIWMMPLMFFIPGGSIYYAMNRGGADRHRLYPGSTSNLTSSINLG